MMHRRNTQTGVDDMTRTFTLDTTQSHPKTHVRLIPFLTLTVYNSGLDIVTELVVYSSLTSSLELTQTPRGDPSTRAPSGGRKVVSRVGQRPPTHSLVHSFGVSCGGVRRIYLLINSSRGTYLHVSHALLIFLGSLSVLANLYATLVSWKGSHHLLQLINSSRGTYTPPTRSSCFSGDYVCSPICTHQANQDPYRKKKTITALENCTQLYKWITNLT